MVLDTSRTRERNGAFHCGNLRQNVAPIVDAEYEKWAATRFEMPLLSTGAAYEIIREAILAPDHFCKRIRSYPRGTRAMEPVENWQTRAVMGAIATLGKVR
jgi:hypothetical protein